MKAAFYKGTRPGWGGVLNRIGRALDHGPYSHCELVFSDNFSGGSSYVDGGVRLKVIRYSSPGAWDFFALPGRLEDEARKWMHRNKGTPYDIWGNVHFVFGFVKDSADKIFCSEAMGLALGWPDAWRYGPNGAACRLISEYGAQPSPTPWKD